MLCQRRNVFLVFFVVLMTCQSLFGTTVSDSLRLIIQTAKSDSIQQASRRKLVRHYWFQDLDSAYKVGLEYLEVAEYNQDSFEIGDAENVLGITCLYQAKFSEAIDHMNRVLNLKQEEGDSSFIASTLNNIAIAHTQMGSLPIALRYYQESLQIKEAQKDSAAIQGSLNNIGAIYQSLEDFERALEYYERGLCFPAHFKGVDDYASNHTNMGFAYFKLGRKDSALVHYTKALDYAEKSADPAYRGTILMHLGSFHEDLEDYALAESYAMQSIDIFESLNKKDRLLECQALLGGIYLGQNKPQKALLNCKKGLEIANGLESWNEKADCLDCLAKAHRKLGNHKAALEALDGYHEIRDSLRSGVLHQQVLKADLDFEYQREQLADSLATAQKNELIRLNYEDRLRSQRFFVYVLILGTVFLLALVTLIYLNFSRKKKLNLLLKEKVRERTMVLEKQNKQLAEYAFINAHHLRGPLTQIQGLVDLLESVPNEKDRVAYLEMLRTSTERLDKVIHEIRDAVESEKIDALS